MTTAPSDELTGADVGAWMLSAALTGVVGWLAGVLLTGMLTVVAGRAIFGSTISAGETWARIRGRLPALIGLVALECVGLVLLAGVVGLIVGAIAAAGNAAAAVLLGLPLVLMSVATVVYLYTALSFAPVLIVLERLPVIDSVTRSLALVRNSFWRVLGIRVLTWLVVAVIAGAIAAPFNFLGHLAGGPAIAAATVGAVGAAIGRIITAPFSAGVVVLLYTDRRIRSEAFDLVLQPVPPRPGRGRVDRQPLADAAGLGTRRGCPPSTSTATPRTTPRSVNSTSRSIPKVRSPNASTSGSTSCSIALWNKARRCRAVGSPPACC